MNVKKSLIRSAVIIGIVVLSVFFGIIVQSFTERAERAKYPLAFEEFVNKYSYDYGVPKNVIYAYIKCSSDFKGDLLSDNGEIGLMQVSPKLLEKYKEELHDPYDAGMLYDPETNIKYGTYHLSKIYLKVGTWRAVYASLSVGVERVTEWLSDERYAEIADLAKPKLKVIPDEAASRYAELLESTADKYKTLYFED